MATMFRNVTQQVIQISPAPNAPDKDGRVQGLSSKPIDIEAGQLWQDPPAWTLKHPAWKHLTGAGGPLQPVG
jgi:hypothetical protein